jgi:hypothetical protein
MTQGKDLWRRARRLWAVFGVPLVLGVLALTGLVGALLYDGVWDGLGAALLATAVAVVVRARFRRR